MRMVARLEAMGMAKYAALTRKSGKRAVWTGALSLDETALKVPLGWSFDGADAMQRRCSSDHLRSGWLAAAKRARDP